MWIRWTDISTPSVNEKGDGKLSVYLWMVKIMFFFFFSNDKLCVALYFIELNV